MGFNPPPPSTRWRLRPPIGYMPVACNRGRLLNPRPWPVPTGHHSTRSHGCALRPGRIYLFIYFLLSSPWLQVFCQAEWWSRRHDYGVNGSAPARAFIILQYCRRAIVRINHRGLPPLDWRTAPQTRSFAYVFGPQMRQVVSFMQRLDLLQYRRHGGCTGP